MLSIVPSVPSIQLLQRYNLSLEAVRSSSSSEGTTFADVNASAPIQHAAATRRRTLLSANSVHPTSGNGTTASTPLSTEAAWTAAYGDHGANDSELNDPNMLDAAPLPPPLYEFSQPLSPDAGNPLQDGLTAEPNVTTLRGAACCLCFFHYTCVCFFHYTCV